MQNRSLLYIVIVFLVLFCLKQHSTIKDQENQISEQQDSIADYQDSLEEANQNIDEANSNIEDAQGYAWSSYDEMGQALENLTTVDTVQEP